MKRTVLIGVLIILLPLVSPAQQPAESSPPGAPPSAENPAAQSDDSSGVSTGTLRTWIRNLGEATPLDPNAGLPIGPFRLKYVETSGFYQDISSLNSGTVHFFGTLLEPALAFDHPLHDGRIAIQYTPQFAVRDGEVIHNFLNQNAGVDFTVPLNARWSMMLGSHFISYQNDQLLNSRNLEAFTLQGNTLILQNSYVQRQTGTIAEDSNISFSYRLNGRTDLTLSPILGASLHKDLGDWNFVTMYGGRVGISRMMTPTRRVFASYDVTHLMASTRLEGLGGWNYHTAAVGIDQTLGRTWTVQVTAGGTYRQGQSQPSIWTPTGTAALVKAFRVGSISTVYSRSRAASTFLYSGYVDQGDFASTLHLSRKTALDAGIGEWRTISSAFHQHGKRAYGSLSYHLQPKLTGFISYNFARQTGTDPHFFIGDSTYAALGFRWSLGRASRY